MTSKTGSYLDLKKELCIFDNAFKFCMFDKNLKVYHHGHGVHGREGYSGVLGVAASNRSIFEAEIELCLFSFRRRPVFGQKCRS